MDTKTASVYFGILRREMAPALGCTEPAAVALAAARAARDLGRPPDRIAVRVSGNLYKNGMGVVVPGIGRAGLDAAAAAGALGGDPDLGLEALRNLAPGLAARAEAMLREGRVTVAIARVEKTLYAEVAVFAGDDGAVTVIEDGHSRITRRERNGRALFRMEPSPSGEGGEGAWPLTLAGIWEFAADPPGEAIAFIREAARLNAAAGAEGLAGDYGLRVGKSLAPGTDGILGDDAASYAVRLTAAGADVRMAGAMFPVMSNSGSGNQGLACTLPILAIARRIGAGEGEAERALILSHAVSIHVKRQVGRLSALCGAFTASIGASCGLVRLLGGDLDAMGRAVRNMAGDLAGMICDGAKAACALKIATSTGAAVKAARLALNNRAAGGDDGIVDADPEASIRHLARLAGEGMRQTDKVILDIMLEKRARNPRAECGIG
ncbi:MAG: L-serine ammonia-lyase, iron-sulfur-dependent, subunit alpha [Planctomycetota bacterium]|jgi:L-cysteine desulfidase|nr:L-serine ammonia-lyase, iron-sulfur-dependent, subunit alpha [Planctomycetota bacterium]